MAKLRKSSQIKGLNIPYTDIIPAALDMEQIEKEFPPFKYYKREHALKLIVTILEGMFLQKDCHDFAYLKAEFLVKQISKYQLYRNYLEGAGVIEVCHSYQKNIKSKGYRISSKYLTGEYRLTEFRDKKLLLTRFTENQQRAIDKFPQIANAIESVKVDPEVEEFLWADLQRKLNGEAPKEFYKVDHPFINGRKILKEKNPVRQYNKAMYVLEKIRTGNHRLTQDAKVSRLHHTVCSLPSMTRSFIHFPGAQISQVDVSGSQFFLLNRVIQVGFWKENDNYLNLDDIFLDTRIRYVKLRNNKKALSLMIENLNSAQYQSYLDKTCSGTFYQSLATEHLTIDEVKQKCFEVLFASPRAPINRDFFKRPYPLIWELIKILQLSGKEMPLLLQSVEAHVMLERVIPRINQEMPGTPIIPIHDSIVAPTSQIEAIKTIMIDEITKCTGLRPHTKITHYNPSEASFKDGVSYKDYILKNIRA